MSNVTDIVIRVIVMSYLMIIMLLKAIPKLYFKMIIFIEAMISEDRCNIRLISDNI